MRRRKPDMYDGDGNIDALKTLLYLKRSKAQAVIRSSIRPHWPDLARALGALRTVGNALLLDGGDRAHLAPRRLLEPRAASRAAADRKAQARANLNTHNDLLMELISEYLVATSDHLWAMSVLMSSDQPFRPLLATGRILLDAGAHTHYLLDPEVGLRERVVRAANVELDAIRQELNDLGADDQRESEELFGQQEALLAAGDADGIPRAVSRKGEIQPRFAPGLITTGRMADLALGEGFGEAIWRLASSVVHARDRSVLEFVGGRGSIDLSGEGLGWTMGVPYVASCLVVMTETYVRTADYLDRGEPVLHDAVQSVFRTVQEMSGDHDDELLARAGIDTSEWV